MDLADKTILFISLRTLEMNSGDLVANFVYTRGNNVKSYSLPNPSDWVVSFCPKIALAMR
ncbi:hypothetical protein VIAQ111709_00485 [Vibrio aquimaris]|uniref:Uncharacterized protein n=1 Tax=Vibrio aquimaris TaxID=2587862 RepID=A0A5P9CNI2_9VIBR|nr:hypothetical protein FIV01_12100 [Vibrio aquimaris]